MKAKSTEEKPWSSRLKKWSKELISIVILMTLVSMALDWYRSTSMPSGEAPSLKAMTTQGLPVDIIQQSQEKPVVLYFGRRGVVLVNLSAQRSIGLQATIRCYLLPYRRVQMNASNSI